MDISDLTPHVPAILFDYDARRDLLAVTRPASGIVNSVLFLKTSHGELVLRAFDDRVGRWKPEKESAVYDHMRSIGIPAPQVLRVDSSKRVAPFMYSLSQRIEGEPLSQALPAFSDDQIVNLYRQLGDYLGKLHSTTFRQFGDVYGSDAGLQVGPVHELDTGEDGAPVGPFVTWADMHQEIVEARLRLMEGFRFEDLIPEIRRFFAEHRDQIECQIVPRLLHMDLHRGNILTKNGEVTAILDVEEATVGHNEYDLMRTELANFRDQPPAFEQAFMQSYQTHVSLDDGYELRKTFYDVSRTLVWIRSLILYGDNYSTANADQSLQAVRGHLQSLLGNG